MLTEEKRKQVAAQCNVVVHLATALARVHADYARMMADGAMDSLIEPVGKRSASFMETLGDMLNGMDAASEEDDWTHPVFKKAHELWPRRVP